MSAIWQITHHAWNNPDIQWLLMAITCGLIGLIVREYDKDWNS